MRNMPLLNLPKPSPLHVLLLQKPVAKKPAAKKPAAKKPVHKKPVHKKPAASPKPKGKLLL